MLSSGKCRAQTEEHIFQSEFSALKRDYGDPKTTNQPLSVTEFAIEDFLSNLHSLAFILLTSKLYAIHRVRSQFVRTMANGAMFAVGYAARNPFCIQVIIIGWMERATGVGRFKMKYWMT